MRIAWVLAAAASLASVAALADSPLVRKKPRASAPPPAPPPVTIVLPRSGLTLKLSEGYGWRADELDIAGDKVDVLSRARGPALMILVPSFVENLACAEWQRARKGWKRTKLKELLPPDWHPRAYERKDPTALEACRDVPGGALTASVLGPVGQEDVVPIRVVLVALAAQSPR